MVRRLTIVSFFSLLLVSQAFSASLRAKSFEELSSVLVRLESTDKSDFVAGTGFMVSPTLGITCFHVLSSTWSGKFKAYIQSQEYEAEFVNGDRIKDIAVFKINKPVLKYLSLENSRKVKLGEKLYVFGFPLSSVVLDKQPILTSGIVSGLRKQVKVEDRVFENLIQTDAYAGPGSSGSLVVSNDFRLIGMIVSAAVGNDSAYRGASFIIPIKEIIRVYPSIKHKSSYKSAARLLEKVEKEF